MLTKQARVFRALEQSEGGLTASQISARYGVRNVRATISSIRSKTRPLGFDVFAERRSDTKGREKTFYVLDSVE
jgi:hypothetical protein